MKLSEAIRLGAMLRPKAKYLYFFRGGSCAIGAACEAIGLTEENVMYHAERVTDEFPLLSVRPVICPECGTSGSVLVIVCEHLNDKHDWTREAIADFVETLEPQEMPHEESTVAVDASVRIKDADGAVRC